LAEVSAFCSESNVANGAASGPFGFLPTFKTVTTSVMGGFILSFSVNSVDVIAATAALANAIVMPRIAVR
jgi:hypothetical protein